MHSQQGLWILLFVCFRATKSPLKVQNRVPEADSPIKKVVKRSRHILDSDDDDIPAVKEEVTKQADKEVKREKVNASMALGAAAARVCLQDSTQHSGGVPRLSGPSQSKKKVFLYVLPPFQ